MKMFKKSVYFIRILFFIAHFFLLFGIISSLLQLKWYGYGFIAIYVIYVIKIITELLSKKKLYQEDLIYNAMQIGLFFYIGVIFYRITFSYAVVVKETKSYFMTNFGIMALLMIFILIYSFIEIKLYDGK